MPTKNKPSGAKRVSGRKVSRNGKAASPLSLTKLGYAIQFVADMKRGVKFYKDVLGIPLRFADEGWTEFEMQGFTLALHPADKMPKNLDRAPITELCFEADDVRGARSRLIRRGVKVSELHEVCQLGPNVGASASFRDPDGNHLSLFGLVPKAEWSGPPE